MLVVQVLVGVQEEVGVVVVIFNKCCTFAGFWSCYDLCDDLILS